MSSDSDDESYIASAERKAKQTYLFEEVIENNYDPELFTSFCSQIKTPDLDSWTFDELQDCVSKFKMTYRRGQTLKEVLELEQKHKKPVKEEKSAENSSENNSPEVKQEKKVIMSKQTENEVDPLCGSASSTIEPAEKKQKKISPVQEDVPSAQYSLRCRTYEDSSLNRCPNLEFILKDPEPVEGGFLNPGYYLYPVKTMPLEWECLRKYTDFLTLQEVISLYFPGHFVPPLPQPKTISKPENEIVGKRVGLIKKFLFWVSKSETVLSHHFVENFFRINAQVDYTKYMKSHKKKMTKVENLEMCFSRSGYLTCNLANFSENFEALNKFLVSSEALEKKLKTQAGVVLKNLKNVENDYKSLGNKMKKLQTCQEIFFPVVGTASVFKEIEKDFECRAENEESFYRSFKEHFREYFTYRNMEKQALRELIKAKETAFNEYKKAEARQKPIERYKDLYGFYNSQSYSEIIRVLNEENQIQRRNFSAMGKKNLESLSNQHSHWSELIQSSKSLNPTS